ncbi:hypothetical protein XENTR_v10018385 [Xenopus tropicalis]|nr:hypothetical protein XENTR_v10018385 [Xenopus tropicalis]
MIFPLGFIHFYAFSDQNSTAYLAYFVISRECNLFIIVSGPHLAIEFVIWLSRHQHYPAFQVIKPVKDSLVISLQAVM